MERELRINEMSDVANPTVLARLGLLHERLPPEVHGYEGEACHQPQVCAAPQRRPLVIRHAPRRPGGE
jgi:hypothetical protein